MLPRSPSRVRSWSWLFAWCACAGLAAETAGSWSADRGLILHGTVVAMDPAQTVIANARVCVQGEQIVAVLREGDAVPPALANAPTVPVTYIYPGLIDAHNHVEYNVYPLWTPPAVYGDRYQWTKEPTYKTGIQHPHKLIGDAKFANLNAEATKYGEVKAILGGVTSIQGSDQLRATSFFVRNIEHPNFGQDHIRQNVLPISAWKNDAPALITAMQNHQVDAFLAHIAEGTDAKIHEEFTTLLNLGLVRSQMVIIHGVPLTPPEFQLMAQAGTSLVWSPLSNLLLYRQTADVAAAKAAGVRVCLGSDWSPSGSKNLLAELKVAREYVRSLTPPTFSDQELAALVTTNPAFALGLDDKIGRISPGYYADLMCLTSTDPDPYRALVTSTERAVSLVIVGGIPLYGDLPIMQQLKGSDLEELSVYGAPKGIDLTDSRFPLGTETLAEITGELHATLRLDRPYLMSRFGQGMTAVQFEDLLDSTFPGIEPIDLDSLLPDDAFFAGVATITGNRFPHLADYWQSGATGPTPPTPTGGPVTDQALIAFVNRTTTTVVVLDHDVGLDRRAAERIVGHRVGPDGAPGTADDVPFTSLHDLDVIPYVGTSALSKLRTSIAAHP